MYGWLVTNGFLHSPKFDELAQLFINAAIERDIELDWKRNTEILIKSFGEKKSMVERTPDFVLFWDKDVLLAEYLEQRGYRVLNSSRAIAVCDDKRKTHLALMTAGLPVPETIPAPMTYANIGFTELFFLAEIEKKLSFPMIVKEAFGSFGEQVYLVKNHEELCEKIKNCGSVELLFQEYIATSRGRDLRLQVVGSQVVGAMERYSENDFRANITAGGHMRPYSPSHEECQLAVSAARAVGADFAGVDLLFGESGPLVCEVNSNAHFKNLMDCCDVNTAEMIMKYLIEI